MCRKLIQLVPTIHTTVQLICILCATSQIYSIEHGTAFPHVPSPTAARVANYQSNQLGGDNFSASTIHSGHADAGSDTSSTGSRSAIFERGAPSAPSLRAEPGCWEKFIALICCYECCGRPESPALAEYVPHGYIDQRSPHN